MSDLRLLVDKSVVITGAGSGVGRAAAILFVQHGARVVCADVREDWAQQTVDLIGAQGSAVAQACDVRREADVQAAVDRAVREFGRLDVMYNNAGVATATDGRSHSLIEQGDDDFDRLVGINLRGVTYGCQIAVRRFLEQGGGGVIVNTGSVAGMVGWGGVMYGASKGAVNQMTRGLAIEAAKHGIRVNAVCPGAVDTPMLARLAASAAGVKEGLTQQKPLARVGTPAEVAAAVVWLCSDAASFVTGHALAVDGGFVAQ